MKKGIIFTTDAVFAIVLVVLIISTGYYYLRSSYTSRVADFSARRTASDIVAVLDYSGVLDTLDPELIENELNNLLPSNLNMSMTIYAYSQPYTTECPSSLLDLNFGCYDHTGTSGCWSGSKEGWVTYPPFENCYEGGENYGGINISDPKADVVMIGCDDIWADPEVGCKSDCDFNDVLAWFAITETDNGVIITLDRDPNWSAGHVDSVVVWGEVGGENIRLEVFNQEGPGYAQYALEGITCTREDMEDILETIQINPDFNGTGYDYYEGKWYFMTFNGSSVDKYAKVVYKVRFK